MAEQDNKQSLFRQQSLQALDAPGENLNAYLRVTTPGVWMVLIAVILFLAGTCVWGTLAHIHTEVPVSIISSSDDVICYVPQNAVNALNEHPVVKLAGEDLLVSKQAGEALIIQNEKDQELYGAGTQELGTVVIPVSVSAELKEGSYEGRIVTEDIRPISFLFNR